MALSHLLRAMQPLRSSSIRPTSILSTQPSAILQCSKPTFISRLYSTQTEDVTPEQEIPVRTGPSPSDALPSLRSYPYTLKKGTVVSVGKMDRCVQVDHHHNAWDNFLRKNFPKVTRFKVSDPRNSLREGDVIEFSSGSRTGRTVHHVVERIIAPFAEAIEERPPVMSREERAAIHAEKRAAKWARREQRAAEGGATPSKVPGHGVEHIGRIRRLVLERTANKQGKKRTA
ncbi:hypothetical protein BDV18DRAFT_134550 [Aspergillus unguis]